MTPLPITHIDGRPAVFLPEDLLAKLKAVEGDELHAIPSSNGIELICNAETARQLELARGVMAQDSDALRKLAE